tara:strand:- start:24748 stop:26031 length:1284 start_codon:yes stop_codon:yes gene_type:complete
MNILLAVTGSISAYKAYDIARLFIKDSCKVRIILTKGALKFIKPETFSYLGVEKVYLPHEDFLSLSESQVIEKYNGIPHIELTKWAEKMVIAPLSANTLANLCDGRANDLLSSTFLAWDLKKPMILFPAMNTKMLANPVTQKNITFLKDNYKNILIHQPDSGELACGDEGDGKLPSVETIFNCSQSFTHMSNNKKILITTGATISPLDPVRFITNSSTGLTGFIMAKLALSLGYQVKVIAGKNATSQLETLTENPSFSIDRVVTTEQMYSKVMKSLEAIDFYFSSAAISDIEFNVSNEKLKKDTLSKSLSFSIAKDVLASVLSSNIKPKFIVGFAAETKLDKEKLMKKMLKKPTQLLIGTEVNNGFLGEQQQGFANSFASYKCIVNTNEKNQYQEWNELSKKQMCLKVIEIFENHYESITKEENRIH